MAGSAGMLMPLQALITSSAAGPLGGYLPAALLSGLTSLACMLVASYLHSGGPPGLEKVRRCMA